MEKQNEEDSKGEIGKNNDRFRGNEKDEQHHIQIIKSPWHSGWFASWSRRWWVRVTWRSRCSTMMCRWGVGQGEKKNKDQVLSNEWLFYSHLYIINRRTFPPLQAYSNVAPIAALAISIVLETVSCAWLSEVRAGFNCNEEVNFSISSYTIISIIVVPPPSPSRRAFPSASIVQRCSDLHDRRDRHARWCR